MKNYDAWDGLTMPEIVVGLIISVGFYAVIGGFVSFFLWLVWSIVRVYLL